MITLRPPRFFSFGVLSKIWQNLSACVVTHLNGGSSLLTDRQCLMLSHSECVCVCGWGQGKRFSRFTYCLARGVSAVHDADRPFILSLQLTHTGTCVCLWLLPTCLCHYLPVSLPVFLPVFLSVCLQAAVFNSESILQCCWKRLHKARNWLHRLNHRSVLTVGWDSTGRDYVVMLACVCYMWFNSLLPSHVSVSASNTNSVTSELPFFHSKHMNRGCSCEAAPLKIH